MFCIFAVFSSGIRIACHCAKSLYASTMLCFSAPRKFPRFRTVSNCKIAQNPTTWSVFRRPILGSPVHDSRKVEGGVNLRIWVYPENEHWFGHRYDGLFNTGLLVCNTPYRRLFTFGIIIEDKPPLPLLLLFYWSLNPISRSQQPFWF